MAGNAVKAKDGETALIFNAKVYTREVLATNVHQWNKTHQKLRLYEFQLDRTAEQIRDARKRLKEAFENLYDTHPEDGVSEDLSLFEGVEPEGPAGSRSVWVNMDSGALAMTALYEVARMKLSKKELDAWLTSLCDTADEFLQSLREEA